MAKGTNETPGPRRLLRVLRAATALAFTSAPWHLVALVLLTVAGGLLPVAAAWTVRAVLDRLAGGGGVDMGTEYGFLATVLGTLRHRGVDVPSPDTLEGLLYTLPEDGLPEGAFFGGRCVVDAPALADALGDTSLTPRVSPYHGYIPLDPARLARHDGLVFIKDVPKNPQPEGGEGDLV